MFATKLTVSEDTLNNYKKLNHMQKGKLRYDRLLASDRNGALSLATNRKDVAVIGGYPYGDLNGMAWVERFLSRGYLTETFRGFDKNGKKN